MAWTMIEIESEPPPIFFHMEGVADRWETGSCGGWERGWVMTGQKRMSPYNLRDFARPIKPLESLDCADPATM
ncbi:hypothetical protein llg_30680 [Luteolibacter sp. LG18]|nr:hypothetical protein llg_30680 [Luteolibacter sp. LG18]